MFLQQIIAQNFKKSTTPSYLNNTFIEYVLGKLLVEDRHLREEYSKLYTNFCSKILLSKKWVFVVQKKKISKKWVSDNIIYGNGN